MLQIPKDPLPSAQASNLSSPQKRLSPFLSFWILPLEKPWASFLCIVNSGLKEEYIKLYQNTLQVIKSKLFMWDLFFPVADIYTEYYTHMWTGSCKHNVSHYYGWSGALKGSSY